VFDERTASALCYTSGTTGNPKGVLFSHRSTILHALAGCLPDAMSLTGRDCILAVVPLFHANGWGLPYNAPMIGANLVFPGPKMGDPATLAALIQEEGVTFAAGVPTVWTGLLAYLDKTGTRLPTLKRTLVGGSAVPLAMIREFAEKHGIAVQQGWGMTEMSPLGTVNTLPADMTGLSGEPLYALRSKQGRAPFGVRIKIVDEHDRELPWDGTASGSLKVRGPWVCDSYFGLDTSPAHDADGWFDTGDIASIDPKGFLQITDRAKDVIKSGGEWISSIDLENIAIAHPAIAEAAVIGVRHPKWDERPIVVAVKKAGQEVSREELLRFYDGKIAKWWTPDDVVFVNELPHTATGKLSKLTLRQQFKDYQLVEKRS
jgi:fatty-acyl-CoA synthase